MTDTDITALVEQLRQLAKSVDPLCGDAADALATMQDKLQHIRQWCDAYPLNVFPEPDFKKARTLLEAGGMTLDSVSASNMRHVLATAFAKSSKETTMVNDTDIKALVERLRRGRRDITGEDVLNAADALEALQITLNEVREVKNGYYEAMADWRVRAEKAEAVLRSIKWRSIDKDNMEFAATITYSQMDEIRALA